MLLEFLPAITLIFRFQNCIMHKNEKEKLKKEYLRSLRLVLDTELSAKNKIQATGSLAVPVLR
jgi:hypothetical protein